ncbi:MAG: hypothetical protein C5B55_06595 [Blastocatellia bacterium]|nr:MAG: hypothetical protein C5B55_06595 [Blastocatellia bacterium]
MTPIAEPLESQQLLVAGNGSNMTELPPRLATANDIRELVQFLKRRPHGVSTHEIPQPLKKRVFHPTKIECYQFWGLVSVNRGRLVLTHLGWQFAHSLDPEARAYRELLESVSIYRAAVEWIEREHLDVLTQDELGSYWREECPWAFVKSAEEDLTAAVITFFHICQAAELGTMTLGKRGQPGRLLIWHEVLHPVPDSSTR